MRSIYRLLILGAFLYHSQLSAAIPINASSPEPEAITQGKLTITGVVIDKATGESLPSVAVMVKGTSVGSLTDADGKFSIQVPDRNATLVFTFVSYQKKEIAVGDKNFIKVTMEENVQMLDEAVVIGYQSVARRNVHGAVTSIKADDLQGITAPSIDIMLQGAVPGVNIQTFSGEPGGRNTFTVRGNTEVSSADLTSSPLIVLDGVPVDPSVVGYSASSANFLSNINPNDILTLDFLKDAAAAAIYGSKAANGVLIITTKRGKEGKPRISFNGRFGIVTKPVTPKIYMGAAERRAKLDQMAIYGNENNLEATPQILTDSINPMFNNATNWFDLFYKNGVVHDYNLTVSGGDEKANYRIGGGYYKEEGTIIGTGFERFSFTGNFVNKVGSRLELNTSVAYNVNQREPVPGGNSVNNAIGMDISNMPSTLLQLTDIDRNRMLGSYEQAIYDNSDDMIRLSEQASYDILKGKVLSFNTQFSYVKSSSRLDKSEPSTANVDRMSSALSESRQMTTWNIENYFTFNKIFGAHSVMALLGQSAEGITSKYSSMEGRYLSSDYIHVVNGVSKDNLTAYSGIEEAKAASFFARASYIFKDRYSISSSIRTDGSSRFGSNQRWGTFPTASAFWLVSEEPFMNNLKDVVSLLKFRGSWGKSGSLPSGFYGHHNRYMAASSTYDGGGAIIPNFADGIAQKELTWEETKEWDLGMDLEFLNGRFTLIADIYNKEKHGIFYSFMLPKTSGYEKYYTNAVAVRNAGVELALVARVLPATSKWQWNLNANISYNKNQIMQLPDGNKTVVEDNRYLMVGQPINSFRLSQYNGIYLNEDMIPFDPYTGLKYKNESGQYVQVGWADYEDVDKDNQYVSWKDKKPIGDPNPKWVGGLNTNLSYGPWSLFVQTSFTLGRDILNTQFAKTMAPLSAQYGADEEGVGFSGGPGANYANPADGHWYYAEDFVARRMMVDLSRYSFWQKDGDNTNYPSRSQYMNNNNFIERSSLFLENGSYLKLNTIMLSYNLDKLKKWGINNARLSLTAENVAIIKSKNTLAADPSNVSPDGYYTGNGYGLPRKFTIGLMFDF